MRHTHRFLLVSALALVAAACNIAFADEFVVAPEIDSFVSTKSRDEVRADLQAFRQSGVDPWSDSYSMPGLVAGSTTTRGDVQAAFLAEREQSLAFVGEDSGSVYLASVSQAHRVAQMPRQIAASK